MGVRQVPVGRPVWVSAGLVVGTVVLGLLVRFGPLGLPWVVRKYGGSVLWAAMVYWMVSSIIPKVGLPWVALVAEATAVGVEFFKRVHTTGVERLRGTTAGVLLLGREFSYADILAYTVAIAGALLLDTYVRERVPVRRDR